MADLLARFSRGSASGDTDLRKNRAKELRKKLRSKLATKYADDEDVCNYTKFADDMDSDKEFSDEELSKYEEMSKKFSATIPDDKQVKLEQALSQIIELQNKVEGNWAFSQDETKIVEKLQELSKLVDKE